MSFGHITDTRLWLSIHRKPFAYWRWILSFGPTYNGTTHGICLATPWFVLIGHVRDKDRSP